MYKLVAMDIDGTLLDSYGNISKENIEAIKKAKEQKYIDQHKAKSKEEK